MATVIKISELGGTERSTRFEGEEYGSTVSMFIGAYPSGFRPPMHRHPYEETFVVQGGTAAFTIDGEEVEVGAGEIAIAPAGAPHTFIVTSESPLRLVSVHPRPRMDQTNLE